LARKSGEPEWCPSTGDIIWVQFDPQIGREQAGHRPAVVLTPADYNLKSGLLICVPLTSRVKGYPFEVAIGGERPGVALVDQVKSLDWRGRGATRRGRVEDAELANIRTMLTGLINL
jgi:mRNA interferase MazF